MTVRGVGERERGGFPLTASQGFAFMRIDGRKKGRVLVSVRMGGSTVFRKQKKTVVKASYCYFDKAEEGKEKKMKAERVFLFLINILLKV